MGYGEVMYSNIFTMTWQLTQPAKTNFHLFTWKHAHLKTKKKKTKQTSIHLDDFFAYLLKADKDIFIHTLKMKFRKIIYWGENTLKDFNCVVNMIYKNII